MDKRALIIVTQIHNKLCHTDYWNIGVPKQTILQPIVVTAFDEIKKS